MPSSSRSSISSGGSYGSFGERPILFVRSPKQPVVKYDLSDKSTNYKIRFETANPHSRFVIQHNAAYYRFDQLPPNDQRELILTALNFAERYELFDASLTIPSKALCPVEETGELFFAYLEVPYVENFLKVYNLYKSEIPSWNNLAWINPLWAVQDEKTVDKSYTASVSMPKSRITVKPKFLAHRFQRPVLKRSSLQSENDPMNKAVMNRSNWRFIMHPSQSLVGVAHKHHIGFPCSFAQRCEALKRLQEIMIEYCGYRRVYACLSLVGPYKFGTGISKNVIGFLAFSREVPRRLAVVSVRPSLSRQQSSASMVESIPEVSDTGDTGSKEAEINKQIKKEKVLPCNTCSNLCHQIVAYCLRLCRFQDKKTSSYTVSRL